MAANILTAKVPIIIIAAIAFIVLLRVIGRLCKRRAQAKELKQLAQDRQREEKLDAVISNPQAADAQAALESIPYEVSYEKSGAEREHAGQGQLMVQLTEHNELSSRKHILSLEKSIRIGSGTEGNSIVVPGASSCQCELFQYEGGVYLREMGEKQMTVLQRKKKKVCAERKGIRVQTGDKIILGKISFDITIVK